MKFTRASAPEDRCWFCRRCCGEPVIGHLVDKFTGEHGRFAQWMPHLQRHVAISAHDTCFYDHADYPVFPTAWTL